MGLVRIIIVLHVMYMKGTHGGTPTFSSPCPSCDGENVTCVDSECLLRCVNVTSSGECLQCGDSRFYGKQCENDCPHTCLNSRCQLTNSRVVCTEGCVTGKKGESCSVNCSEGCINCQRYGDNCTGLCKKDYYGTQCENSCSSNCADGCVKNNGSCYRCKLGYQGNYCDTPCPSGCSTSDGCAECLKIDRIKTVGCSKQCPQNCTICLGTTVPEATVTTLGSTTPMILSESNETLKIVCAVLGTMLSTVAAVFIYKKCTKHRREIHRTTHHNRIPMKYRCSTEHSASSQYMSSKYWEIQDEDLDSSTEDKHVISDHDVPCYQQNDHELPLEIVPPPEHQIADIDDVKGAGHPLMSQDGHVPSAVKTDELTLRCPSDTRARSWNCERNEPKRVVTIPRPHSDSSASGQTLDRQTVKCLPFGDSEVIPIIKFVSERTCDMSDITVQYLTANVNETIC